MFQWVCKLGMGGFGEVWRGIWSSDKQEYAVKFLKEPYASAILRRFEREGTALTGLRHPNIVRCVGFMQFDKGPGLIMEYLPGGSLRDRINRGPMPISSVIEIMYAVLNALHHAHRAYLIHRDIKPDNILFTRTGLPKVSDFGLVKVLTETADGLTVGAVGTPGYMAPELVENPAALSLKADIFSAGVTLYEMLTGRTLQFDGQRVIPPSRINPSVIRDLDVIVLTMVATDPNRRYATADLAAKALAPIWKVYKDWEKKEERERKEALQNGLAAAACAIFVIGMVALLASD